MQVCQFSKFKARSIILLQVSPCPRDQSHDHDELIHIALTTCNHSVFHATTTSKSIARNERRATCCSAAYVPARPRPIARSSIALSSGRPINPIICRRAGSTGQWEDFPNFPPPRTAFQSTTRTLCCRTFY